LKKPPKKGDERAALLAAAPALAAQLPLAALTARAICTEAGVSNAMFRRHFPDISAYLLAAQQVMMNEIRDAILGQVANARPGFSRIRGSSEIYLDRCLSHQALRGWLIDARRNHPELTVGLRRQNQVYALLLAGEFRTLGWPHPAAAARLYLAMLMECGLVEHRAGRPVDDVRETLWDFLRTFG
jgi:AcrR family transcriptional regulator